jgi:small-conductance mechanosensitive channel
MSERSSLEAVWAEIHSFTVDQNSRSASKTRSNRRSISLTLPITLLLAIIILMGSWLWLLGGGVLWLLYKILNDDDWTVSSWRRRKRASARIQSARPGAPR